MLDSVLIANRGEIALRIMRTARRLGMRTVAVHSDADADAPHARFADEAVRLGPAPARDSYLDIARVIDAARATGAAAVHPGYGFLSENAAFAEALEAAGIVFVGPPASAIRAMGSKSEAKALMAQAGVPIVPGYHGTDQDPALLAAEAGRIGYPVLIKASAGGGGKGMRRVDDAAAFAEALDGAGREARAAFGDDRVLVEKYIARPRHIEMQIFADAAGNAVHLFERDCSLQRRHQKVIEEAPAPLLPDGMRAAMGAAAVEAARAIGYRGAGTVEFIAETDADYRPTAFYFMEMNTRLQVEHPLTEAITGQDLVEWQLRVAAGEPLPLAQEAIRREGHAIEARLYAEDPASGFLPSTGRLVHLAWPRRGGGVRVDAGVAEGGAVGPHYDPMLAKIVAHGPDREAARARLIRALGQTEVAGLATNRDFLIAALRDPAFAAGRVDTHFIDTRLDGLLAPADAPEEAWILAALWTLEPEGPARDPWGDRRGWRLGAPAPIDWLAREAGETVALSAAWTGAAWRIEGAFGTVEARVVARRGRRLAALVDGRRLAATVVQEPDGRLCVVGARATRRLRPLAPDERAARAEETGEDAIRAPMPGRIVRLFVAEGEAVAKGAALMIVEAMKMEHTLKAPHDGVVAELLGREGAQVAEGALLARIDAT